LTNFFDLAKTRTPTPSRVGFERDTRIASAQGRRARDHKISI
jgi:hypothetical protein